MLTRRLSLWFAAAIMLIVTGLPAQAYVAYDTHAQYQEVVTRDLMRLIPRAMSSYLFQNRYDFLRGATFMTRNIMVNPLKNKDMEEVRREAYERLRRDIPYCVDALKGGELKLDTSPGNLSGRLGMIANSITLLSMPAFPELEHLERFSRLLEELIVENQIDMWVYYDGYGDFQCLGELMERLRPQEMPTFRHVRNDLFAAQYKEDPYVVFRSPDKYHRHMIITNVDVTHVYNTIINNIADTFVFIWKCSGMDLAHPSYAAPPGTIISRTSRRSMVSGGVLTKPAPPPVAGETIPESQQGPRGTAPEGSAQQPAPAEQPPGQQGGEAPPPSVWR